MILKTVKKKSQRHIDRHVVNKRLVRIARSKICRQGFAEGSPLTARSANTSNFAITRFCDQAYKLPSALCVQGPEIETHLELTAYVIAEWHFTKLFAAPAEWLDGATTQAPRRHMRSSSSYCVGRAQK